MQRSIVSKALIRFKVQKRRFLSSNKDGTSFIEWKAFAAGTGAGILGSLVGLGGGFVMIPFLCSPMMGLTQHMAHGTSLFAVTTTGLAGGISYGGKGEVDLYSASAIAISGIVTARLGAKFSGRLSQSSLKRALGITMIAVSPMVSLKSYLIQNDKTKNDDKPDDSISSKDFDWKTIGVSSCIGLLSGFMAGLLGVGGGSIVVPGLTLLTDMSHHCALGTSLTAMGLPALSGTYTHWKLGNVDRRVAPFLAFGSLIGAYGGGQLGLQIDEDRLRYGFSGMMLVLGLRTAIKA